jgi:hypothetical protein
MTATLLLVTAFAFHSKDKAETKTKFFSKRQKSYRLYLGK